jgi:hypothetical protein
LTTAARSSPARKKTGARSLLPVLMTSRMFRLFNWRASTSGQTIIVVIFSGRSDEVRQETEDWLNKHQVPYNLLLMRKAGDFTADEELKRAWLAQFPKEQILCIFDDRNKVVKMWRDEGVPCFQVADGDF